MNTEPLIIKCGDSSYGVVFNISQPIIKDRFVNGSGKDQATGCWGINDPNFSDFIRPNGTACGITSITVPTNMMVSTYHGIFGVRGDDAFIVKPENLLTIYPPGSETILDAFAGKIIMGFKFEYV